MEMCLAWGLPPNAVEALPRNVRKEMEVFYDWKVKRETLLREQAQAEAQAKARGR